MHFIAPQTTDRWSEIAREPAVGATVGATSVASRSSIALPAKAGPTASISNDVINSGTYLHLEPPKKLTDR